VSYFNRLTTAFRKECSGLKERIKQELSVGATKRSHELIAELRPDLEKLKPESWFLAGYERGVSDVIEKLEITDREILRALNATMKNVN
jgi:hypothetical protein